jgi:hypothetical protein
MNAIYEEDFLGFSYGFRPGRSQHDALDARATGIVRNFPLAENGRLFAPSTLLTLSSPLPIRLYTLLPFAFQPLPRLRRAGLVRAVHSLDLAHAQAKSLGDLRLRGAALANLKHPLGPVQLSSAHGQESQRHGGDR